MQPRLSAKFGACSWTRRKPTSSGAFQIERVVSVGRRPEEAAVMQFSMRCRTAMKLAPGRATGALQVL